MQNTIGIFVHIFYDDLVDEIASYIANISANCHLYISTDTEVKKHIVEARFRHESLNGSLRVKVLPNIGRDIAPFLLGFADEIRRHDICLRLHTKKSTHNSPEFGARWREYLFTQLIGNPQRVDYVLDRFALHSDLGILMGQHWPGILDWTGIGENYDKMRWLLGRGGISLEPHQQIEFPSGGMFWFRSTAIQPLLDLGLTWDDFAEVRGEDRDGTLVHAIERSFLFFAAAAGYRWAFLPLARSPAEMGLDEQIEVIRSSGLFDEDFYLRHNPDVAHDGVDPITHYAEFGWKEGRDPSPTFDTRYYAKTIANTLAQEVNPLVHYILQGRAKGVPTRRPETVSARITVEDVYAAYKRTDRSPPYVAETRPLIQESGIKLIAFYLPQFHPFPENDRFWGLGFTEWTNTSKALPLFKGHYQPRLPGELGFYDLRLKEVLARQIELAKQYGIYGFCLHHYFFEGRPVMRAPYNLLLAHPDLDIPFCLHWANEPWTATWDGLARKDGTLLDQRHSAADDLAFFRDIEPALKDPRYIRVDGKPLLVIYRPSLFPDITATIERWRACCRLAGIGDLYLAVMQSWFEGKVDPRDYGFDAAIEYPPHNLTLPNVAHRVQLYDPGFAGAIGDYRDAMTQSLGRKAPDYELFRGIITGWDCTARRADPYILINNSPELYREWLTTLCRYSADHLADDHRLIFINAWNEWAECAYLEPDRKFGYAYLDATAQALNEFSAGAGTSSHPRLIVGAHIFYLDLLDEFIGHFAKIPIQFDLFITTTSSDTAALRKKIAARLSNAVKIVVRRVENVGRDGAPFVLDFLPASRRYDLACWVHSKKSCYEPAYNQWRNYLLTYLLGSSENIESIIETFARSPSVGVLYPPPFRAVTDRIEWGSNFATTSMLLQRIGITIREDEKPSFPPGAMFWFRPAALALLLQMHLTLSDFEKFDDGPRDSQTGAVTDGTLAHAIERMIFYVANAAGFEVCEHVIEATPFRRVAEP